MSPLHEKFRYYTDKLIEIIESKPDKYIFKNKYLLRSVNLLIPPNRRLNSRQLGKVISWQLEYIVFRRSAGYGGNEILFVKKGANKIYKKQRKK